MKAIMEEESNMKSSYNECDDICARIRNNMRESKDLLSSSKKIRQSECGTQNH
jgi:hypothetical protein